MQAVALSKFTSWQGAALIFPVFSIKILAANIAQYT
jgi:hypothetical protein